MAGWQIISQRPDIKFIVWKKPHSNTGEQKNMNPLYNSLSRSSVGLFRGY